MKRLYKITSYLFILGCFFIFPNPIFATTNDIIINELAWMGTEVSYNDEWIAPQKDTLKL